MTCIVGVTHKNKIYLGADSFSGNPRFQLPTTTPKIFKNGCLSFGISGSWRLNQILTHDITFPARKPKDVDKFLIRNVIPCVQEVIESIRTIDEEFVMVDFLMGCGGRLFHVQDDLAITENPDGFDCAGMGWETAIATLRIFKDSPPKERLQKALEMVEAVCPLVRNPFDFKEF